MPKPTLPRPALMLVTDRHVVPEGALASAVRAAVDGGVNVVQLREKDLPAAELLALGRALQDAIAGRARFIVSERVDVAAALDADGVQLPEDGLPVEAARGILGPDKLIGRSVHTEEGATAAVVSGADYLVLGSVFSTDSHPDGAPLGLDIVRHLLLGIPSLDAQPMGTSELREDVRSVAPVPVLGIGGVTADNAAQVMAAGAAGVAVISAILKPNDPRAAAQRLRAALGSIIEGL